MIALGILLIVVGLIACIWSGLTIYNEKYILTILLFVLATFFCSLGASWIRNECKSCEQKIECSEIKQIDTLYKNDSIIGYEVIILQ